MPSSFAAASLCGARSRKGIPEGLEGGGPPPPFLTQPWVRSRGRVRLRLEVKESEHQDSGHQASGRPEKRFRHCLALRVGEQTRLD